MIFFIQCHVPPPVELLGPPTYDPHPVLEIGPTTHQFSNQIDASADRCVLLKASHKFIATLQLCF